MTKLFYIKMIFKLTLKPTKNTATKRWMTEAAAFFEFFDNKRTKVKILVNRFDKKHLDKIDWIN
jgi:hypothetical protein